MAFEIIHDDCFEWLQQCPMNSFHAVITDPPFGLREFTRRELDKMKSGRGGVWRIPPKIGGSERSPLPRFTVLSTKDVALMKDFFCEWAKLIYPVLVPGGLRRLPDGNPFLDVIESIRTPQREREIAQHPSLKPLIHQP